MTLYEKIKTIVESWHIAITQNNRRYILWTSMSWEKILRSLSANNIEDCYHNLSSNYLTKEEIKEEYEEDWEKYIWIYQKPLRIPKEGDIVQVLENIKQFWDWTDMTWMGFTFKGLNKNNTARIYQRPPDYENIYFDIPLSCLAPWVEPDTDPTIKIIDGKRYKLLD